MHKRLLGLEGSRGKKKTWGWEGGGGKICKLAGLGCVYALGAFRDSTQRWIDGWIVGVWRVVIRGLVLTVDYLPT